MIVGFDYGSSNCAMGVVNNEQVELAELDDGKSYLPSALYAQHPALIANYVAKNLRHEDFEKYRHSRSHILNSIASIKRDLDLDAKEAGVSIGADAINEYLNFPEEGYFVKSPKSFFGAVGLKQQQIDFFEDIASNMIMQIKERAEQHLGYELSHTVIGRPVNFQAIGGEKSNQQAIRILTTAAKRAGFKEVEFLYEPLAAGVDFESRLNTDKKVLVVDIGGGTSDCSFVQMGPSYRNKTCRNTDFLSHTGKRIGGNDLDIALAFHEIADLFGRDTQFKSGLPMPNQIFWQALKINDLQMQSDFYSEKNHRDLTTMLRDIHQPEYLSRLIKVQQNRLSHHVIRQAELMKITLSDRTQSLFDLSFIESNLNKEVTKSRLSEVLESSLEQICALAQAAIQAANTQPDLIYLTGGSAQSPILKSALELRLGNIKMISGDNFGSVTAGLTKWAEKLYR